MVGGDGRIEAVGVADADYADGAAYVNAKEDAASDLWFEVHERPRLDDAVDARDWDAAVTALVRHFESREDLVDIRQPDGQLARHILLGPGSAHDGEVSDHRADPQPVDDVQ